MNPTGSSQPGALAPQFILKFDQEINGFKVSVYEVNLSDSIELSKLENYIKNKIQSMRIHDVERLTSFFSVPGTNLNYKNKAVEAIKQYCRPSDSKISWFDVKRSRVTEFMAQCLLEKEFGCVFHKEADKRINLEAFQADKHVEGIDVTGIHKTEGSFKFVACEVKASKGDPPCSSSEDLLTDIKKAYHDEKRLPREILHYIDKINGIESDADISNILCFLIGLLKESSSKEQMLRNVIFFPFLVRNNEKITSERKLDDFENFKQSDFDHSTLKGIIWSFNVGIDEFCLRIYNEALKK
jgi:hypothetical protein